MFLFNYLIRKQDLKRQEKQFFQNLYLNFSVQMKLLTQTGKILNLNLKLIYPNLRAYSTTRKLEEHTLLWSILTADKHLYIDLKMFPYEFNVIIRRLF